MLEFQQKAKATWETLQINVDTHQKWLRSMRWGSGYNAHYYSLPAPLLEPDQKPIKSKADRNATFVVNHIISIFFLNSITIPLHFFICSPFTLYFHSSIIIIIHIVLLSTCLSINFSSLLVYPWFLVLLIVAGSVREAAEVHSNRRQV